ncbi:M1 family aminopeptidase [Spirosoma sp. SC4-14]|uniref:M1 family aminopeptidase n=1 Tax=Spirosoma sp. SC4-14 TaxID=3128900 RepID=UPI0030CB845E
MPAQVKAQPDTTDNGWLFCQQGKIRYAQKLAANPKARLAYPGDQSIDITYYGLDLKLTHTPNYLRGAATITLKSTAASTNSFFLDFNSTTAAGGLGLQVDSVKANGQHLSYQHAQNRLTITPAQSLTNGQALTLTVYYQGIPNSRDLGSFVFGKHEATNDPVIWSLSEPYGSPDWFPCKDTPGDKADSSAVSITAPAQFVSVSNGVLVSTTDNADGTRTYRWKNSYPIAQYLISIALTNYQQFDTPITVGGQQLPITHYIYPETLPQVQSNLALTPKMIQLFTNRFGSYPFWRAKYGHAQIGRYTGGMEHQTISSMEDRALTPRVIAHELAHQWFGDKITCRDWQNIWLNEGFASYAEAVYVESESGKAGYQSTMNNFMASARAATGSIYVQDISNFNNIFNSNRTYAKGATVLHMLRGVVGDSTFFRILRTYAATPSLAYNTAITEDFQAVAEQVSGQKLDYFFKQWIYGEGYPVYRATAYVVNTATNVMVQLQQRNATATNPASFTMPVQLQIQSAAGDTLVTVFHTQADQTFTLPCRGTVTGVIIDPNNLLLKVAENTILSPITAINEPKPTQFGVYPNPAQETITIDFSLQRAGPVTLTLTNTSGQRVGGLTEANVGSGRHTRMLSLHGLSAGRYIVTLHSGNGHESRVVLIH